MEVAMTFEKIRDLVVEQLGIDADMVKPETNMMKDLEADSLDAVEIILGIEEEFGIDIPDEEAEKFETVQDLVDYVDQHEGK
jgi:acyl carrier protein